MRVVVVGAGLSGLCLVQGLTGIGVEAALFERDAGPFTRGQGYRIRIGPEGVAALRSCLPPPLFDRVVATAGVRSSAVTVLSSGLDVLHRTEFPASPDEGTAGLSVDRQTLRRLLLSGIEGRTRFGAAVTHYAERPGGVRVSFADGTTADADLLVGADGAGSRIRQQLLPGARLTETGQVLVFGRTVLDDDARTLTPPASLEGFATVAGSGGRFMPLAAHRFRERPAGENDYLMWVLGAPAGTFGPGLADRDGLALRTLVTEIIADWHPAIAELVRRGDPATVGATVVRTAEPVPPWPTGPVTLMGDAIHCMIPAGIGAGTALFDAGLLTSALRDGRSAADALRAYEPAMLDHGFAAVAQSLASVPGR